MHPPITVLLNLVSLFQECERHLSEGSEAESHYKAVCRALVSESLELTSFMEKIKSQDAMEASDELKELAVQDWVIGFSIYSFVVPQLNDRCIGEPPTCK